MGDAGQVLMVCFIIAKCGKHGNGKGDGYGDAVQCGGCQLRVAGLWPLKCDDIFSVCFSILKK